ncbi:hypothetical protein D3C74_351340 [compost metagenome]
MTVAGTGPALTATTVTVARPATHWVRAEVVSSTFPAFGSTSTATERAGTVTVPVAVSHVVVLTTGSAPSAWTGESAYSRPASPATVCVTGSGEALKTTSAPSSSLSVSGPTVSSMLMTITPGVWPVPASGNVTFWLMRSALPRRNRSVEERSRSRSAASADAVAMSCAPGLSAGLASRGAMSGHFSPLSASSGSPLPNPLSVPVQSIALYQSPES